MNWIRFGVTPFAGTYLCVFGLSLFFCFFSLRDIKAKKDVYQSHKYLGKQAGKKKEIEGKKSFPLFPFFFALE